MGTDTTFRKHVDIGYLTTVYPFHKSTFTRWVNENKFPAPHFIGQARLWYLDEILSWQDARIAERAQEKAIASAVADDATDDDADADGDEE